MVFPPPESVDGRDWTEGVTAFEEIELPNANARAVASDTTKPSERRL
jgi:hypothetical protein